MRPARLGMDRIVRDNDRKLSKSGSGLSDEAPNARAAARAPHRTPAWNCLRHVYWSMWYSWGYPFIGQEALCRQPVNDLIQQGGGDGRILPQRLEVLGGRLTSGSPGCLRTGVDESGVVREEGTNE